MRAEFDAADSYRLYAQNYQRAFALYNALVEELRGVSTRDFPLRPVIYRETADLYSRFREYAEAKDFYRIIVEDPAAKTSVYLPYFYAMHGLGICYRNDGPDYERADSCFRTILDSVTRAGGEALRVWGGIAEGSLGIDRYLQRRDDEAYPLLLSAAGRITRPNDYSFLSQVHVCLADILLRRGSLAQAGKHLDRALELHRLTRYPEKTSELYRVQGKYCGFTGRPAEAAQLLDSTLMASERDAEAFSGLVLRRIEQQLREKDSQLHQQQMGFYRLLTLIGGTILVLVTALLGVIVSLYRKKHRAYRELVRKSQQWAGVGVAEAVDEGSACDPDPIAPPAAEPDAADRNADGTDVVVPGEVGIPSSEEDAAPAAGGAAAAVRKETAQPDETDRTIMQGIHRAVVEEKLFRATTSRSTRWPNARATTVITSRVRSTAARAAISTPTSTNTASRRSSACSPILRRRS